jgi:hypothetical protein
LSAGVDPTYELQKLDHRPIPNRPGEIRCFVCLRNEALRLPYFLDYYREMGVDRFFITDNGSTDGSVEYLLEQRDCHTFHCGGNYFAENVTPPRWTNTHLSLFGAGYWSITVDPDELLTFPGSDRISLRTLCSFLEQTGADAFFARMLDMYPKRPIAKAVYERGRPFLTGSSYFDADPGWIKALDGQYPPIQIFGGVRQRVFWKGSFKRGLPPCLSKVPLVKWRKGMRYLASMHLISPVKLSPLKGALLHFKFLTGFKDTMATTVAANTDVVEKGLEERASYLAALRQNPDLTLWNSASVRYRGPGQLVTLGLMESSDQYDAFVAAQAPEAGRASRPSRRTEIRRRPVVRPRGRSRTGTVAA